jgi:beta-xylosidase
VNARGRYYLFYSAKRRRDGNHCVAAATAASPRGPFRDRGPIACADRTGQGYIDAAPLIVSARTAYLFLAVDRPRRSISVIPLSRDLLRPAGRRRVVVPVAQPWQLGLATETVEGPFPVRHAGRYYLFYSAGCWCFDYRMGYAVASSPEGPYRDSGANPILVGAGALVAPGGGSVFTGPGGRTELAFHAWTGTSAYPDGGMRTLRIAPITWNGAVPGVGLGP